MLIYYRAKKNLKSQRKFALPRRRLFPEANWRISRSNFSPPLAKSTFPVMLRLLPYWLLCETGKINLVGRKVTLAQETRAGIFPVTLSRRDGRIDVTMTQRLPQFVSPSVTPKEMAQALNVESANCPRHFRSGWRILQIGA